jgi:hypothetical protein
MDIKKIQERKELFLEIVKKYDVCSPELLEFLEKAGFYTAPASTMTSLHNAFDGGLVDHLIILTRRLLVINEANTKLDPNHRIDPKNVARVGLLHAIGRSNLYVPEPREWHRKNLGKMYEFNDKLTSMTVGERSIYYIATYGGNMKLTEDEHQAILHAEKDDNTDMAVKWYSSILSDLLRDQIKWAIRTEKINNA